MSSQGRVILDAIFLDRRCGHPARQTNVSMGPEVSLPWVDPATNGTAYRCSSGTGPAWDERLRRAVLPATIRQWRRRARAGVDQVRWVAASRGSGCSAGSRHRTVAGQLPCSRRFFRSIPAARPGRRPNPSTVVGWSCRSLSGTMITIEAGDSAFGIVNGQWPHWRFLLSFSHDNRSSYPCC